MVKKLTKHGNSYALVIERGVMDLLKIEPDTPLEISTNGDALIVSPVRDPEHRERFERALEAVNRKHAKALRKLGE